MATLTTPVTESLEAYRTTHRAAPGQPDTFGTVRCVVDGFRLVQNKRGQYRHDTTRVPVTTGFPR